LPAASRPTFYASQTLSRAQPVGVRQTCPHAASSSSTSVQGIKHSLLQCSIAPYMVRCTPLIGLYGGTRVRIDRNPANVTVGFSTIPLMVMRRQGNLIQLSYCRVKQIFTRGPPTRRRQFRRVRPIFSTTQESGKLVQSCRSQRGCLALHPNGAQMVDSAANKIARALRQPCHSPVTACHTECP
jgi:hypothetical protein